MLYNILVPYIGETKEENLDSLIHPENNHEELFILPLSFFPFSYTQVSTDWSTEGRMEKWHAMNI